MVWNSTQSALYKAVDDYNSTVISGGNCRKKLSENSPENCAEKCSKNDVNFEQKIGENRAKKICEKSAENCSENCPKSCENFCKNCPKNDSLSRLFSDRDFLLVAGLILVLMNEKADFKLILALAIVLLG